jgi:hypothetical protein
MKTNNNPHAPYFSSNRYERRIEFENKKRISPERQSQQTDTKAKACTQFATTKFLEDFMNTIGRLFTTLSFAVSLFAASAHAQFNDRKVTANIPFDFTVGKTDLPAGNYVFLRTGTSFLLVRNAAGTDLLTVVTAPAEKTGAPSSPKLRFKTEAGKKVLFEIWQSESSGMELYSPHQAVELATTASGQLSGNGRP